MQLNSVFWRVGVNMVRALGVLVGRQYITVGRYVEASGERARAACG